MIPRDWQILMIGGGTGTGKTSLARQLGKRFEVPTLEGDVLRWVIESALLAVSDPDLHPFHDTGFWNLPVQDMLDRSLRQSKRVCLINEAVLARHHFTQRPLILEAVWLLPEFAAQRSFDGVEMAKCARSSAMNKT
jgi:2-phosphoglycerate kinase